MPDRQSDTQLESSSSTAADDARHTHDPAWARGTIAVALAYLAVRLIYLAFQVDPALPPDEITHAGFAAHHVDFWGLPGDTPNSHALGLVSHRPFLYSWALARWLQIHSVVSAVVGSEFVSQLVWMRLANVGLAFATLFAGLAFARRAGASAGACALFVVVLSNLPMWSFLSATVNYDNAAMAIATLCFALLARAVDAPSPRNAIALLSAAFAGVLTKTAFLPFAALLTLAALVATRGAIARNAFTALRTPLATGLGQLAVLAVLASLALGIYGRNVVKFGLLEPAPHQVLELEAANRNRIFQQEHTLRSFRAGAIDFRQAVAEIAKIEHEGDRAGAMWMLRRAHGMRDGTNEPLQGRAAYSVTWTGLMAERLFGVMGHRDLYKSGALAAAYSVCALLGLLALAWRLRRPGTHLRTAAFVGVAYAAILMQAVNYPMYVASGIEVEAVQGRYLFPVLAAGLATVIIASSELLPARARLPVGLAVGALFVLGDFPYFLATAGPEWFGNP